MPMVRLDKALRIFVDSDNLTFTLAKEAGKSTYTIFISHQTAIGLEIILKRDSLAEQFEGALLAIEDLLISILEYGRAATKGYFGCRYPELPLEEGDYPDFVLTYDRVQDVLQALKENQEARTYSLFGVLAP